MKAKISDLKRIRLGRGEVLLVQTNEQGLSAHLVASQLNKFNERRRDKRLPKIPFLVADHRLTFSVISRKKAKAIKKAKAKQQIGLPKDQVCGAFGS
jgi:hypothetical protein